jgi:aconitase B
LYLYLHLQKRFLSKDKDLLQLRKYSIKCSWTTPGKILHAGSDVRVEVNIVGSQDTTRLMTSQELESMAVISPIVNGAYQSGCHTASVWDNKSKLIFQD